MKPYVRSFASYFNFCYLVLEILQNLESFLNSLFILTYDFFFFR